MNPLHEALVGLESIVEGVHYVSTGVTILKGFARVCEDSNTGVLKATLTLEPKSPSPRTWDLTFFKSDQGALSEAISAMEEHAAGLANKLRRGEPAPPFPALQFEPPD